VEGHLKVRKKNSVAKAAFDELEQKVEVKHVPVHLETESIIKK
jgi:hypothetical protein